TDSESGGRHSAASQVLMARFTASSPDPEMLAPSGGGQADGGKAKEMPGKAPPSRTPSRDRTPMAHGFSKSHVRVSESSPVTIWKNAVPVPSMKLTSLFSV